MAETSLHDGLEAEIQKASRLGALQSFGFAALLVLAGVTGSWVVLTQGASDTGTVLPEVPVFAWSGGESTASFRSGEESFFDRGELAFAAGRMVEPLEDNALFYYRAALEESPNDPEALNGLERVGDYLRNQAEAALFRNNWQEARYFANAMRNAKVKEAAAAEVLAKISQFEDVERLVQQATSQLSAGLLDGRTDSALASYRAILKVDPRHPDALEGVKSVAMRLITNAQTAAFSDDRKEAQALIERAKAIDPTMDAIAETEKLTERWHDMASAETAKTSLRNASRALARDQLIAPAEDNALSHYKDVLTLDPGSEAGQRGLRLVQERLIERAWSLIRSDELAPAELAIQDALKAGVLVDDLLPVREELAYQKELEDARNGKFSVTKAISDLKPIRQTAPDYPRSARTNGWVELIFTVATDGSVMDASVRKSSDQVFEISAVSAIERWRFEPHMENGRPMPVRSGVRFSFQEQ